MAASKLPGPPTRLEILWDDDDDVFGHILSIGDFRRSSQIKAFDSQRSSKQGRKVAGNKRVALYRVTQGYGGTGNVLQSICATPGLEQFSFEELRCECYAQSYIAIGAPPKSVDSVNNPWAVIPPIFNATKDSVDEEENADLFLREIIMADV